MKKQSQFVRSAFRVLRAAKWNLKKQSQFVPGLFGATSYLKGRYDNNTACGAEENKANQSQIHTEPGILKRKQKAPTPATTIAVIEWVRA